MRRTPGKMSAHPSIDSTTLAPRESSDENSDEKSDESSGESSDARAELGRFLRARRAALAPEAVGLRSGARRRTPGLRREELAELAGIGVTWYTWLEQGRDIQVSTDVLSRIAAALRLSPSDTRYLYALAGARPQEAASGTGQRLDPRVQLALDAVAGGPAVLVDARLDVCAFNRIAELLYEFDAYEGPFQRNHLWRAFMDPTRRRLYGECWDSIGPWFVGTFRANYAAHIGDRDFEALLLALRQHSPEFEGEWRAHHTAEVQLAVPLPLLSRRWGRVLIHSVRFLLPDLPGYLLFIGPPADAQTAEIFRKMQAG
jgi:transcriptional regulator with XRE-family HTH domain